jgi:5-methylcytosine-specific restriction endonuclease McrA
MKLTNGSCWNCGTTEGLSEHHIYGGRNRKLSTQYGMLVDLCFDCHRKVHDEPDQLLNNKLKAWGQNQFETLHNGVSFISVFDRNYK